MYLTRQIFELFYEYHAKKEFIIVILGRNDARQMLPKSTSALLNYGPFCVRSRILELVR